MTDSDPATVMALLVNPANPALVETQSSEVLSAAHSLGLELHILNASSERDFDAVFANLIQLRAGGLVIGPDPFAAARLWITIQMSCLQFSRYHSIQRSALKEPDYRLEKVRLRTAQHPGP